MKFRLFSDLHFEFSKYHVIQKLPHLEGEQDMIVLLAGDINPVAYYPLSDRFFDWMDDVCARHRAVVFVAGNHEYYHGDISETISAMKERFKDYYNLYVLENEKVEFDNVAIIGATLWTDYYNESPIAMNACQNRMADFKCITNIHGPQNPWHPNLVQKIIATDIIPIHQKSRDYIFEEIKRCKADGKRTIVITHHAPSALSISEEFKNDECNAGYINDFSEQFLDGLGPDIWVHGHVHSSHDYTLGGTRVLANPHGIGNENQEVNREEGSLCFNYNFIFEVK
jgi:predicted phosphohydrolase